MLTQEKKHFDLHIIKQNGKGVLKDIKEYFKFLKYFENTYYKKNLCEKEFNEALWEEFFYQKTNFIFENDINNKIGQVYTIWGIFLGQLLLHIHENRLIDLKKVQGKILSNKFINSALIFDEAFRAYDLKLEECKKDYKRAEGQYFNLINDIPKKMKEFNSQQYRLSHSYSASHIFCLLIERLLIEKFKIILSEYLEKKFKKYWKKNYRNNFSAFLNESIFTQIKEDRYRDLKNIFNKDRPVTLSYLIKIGFFQKTLNNNFLEVLKSLFMEDSLNLRNNIAHMNFTHYDYFHLTFTATLLQVLLYIMNNDYINIKKIDYIFEK